ncbi:hypothetical protein TorRG33x02_347540 [Trema orientale]|uniref:Uncharacterized protein n=1 Tax=Trema orientale TaxID=63057 RepID=A0A2P5ALE9_TREOI|nr:hypothetical protein TorRG33x02_347540 [Trema orientale]
MKLKIHMDSAFLLLREHVWLFPKTYGDKMAIVDSNLDEYMRRYWQSFKSTKTKNDLFDSCFVEYVTGDIEQFKRT